jgi:hypothetical protein
MPAAIETTALTRRFGDFIAVDQLNRTVEAGPFFGFLGLGTRVWPGFRTGYFSVAATNSCAGTYG